ncbi:hypothetical protein M9458_053799, partial [Cirrhinus mrigala]
LMYRSVGSGVRVEREALTAAAVAERNIRAASPTPPNISARSVTRTRTPPECQHTRRRSLPSALHQSTVETLHQQRIKLNCTGKYSCIFSYESLK